MPIEQAIQAIRERIMDYRLHVNGGGIENRIKGLEDALEILEATDAEVSN